MRPFAYTTAGCVLRLVVCLGAQEKPAADAQQNPKTDVQMDGLLGPVKSVVTSIQRLPVEWTQPNGLALIWPVPCEDCDYAPDGSRLKQARMENGRIRGTLIGYERDGNGRIVHQREVDAETGALQRETAFGPYGRTQDTWYGADGKVFEREKLWYDANGYVNENAIWDEKGHEWRHGYSVYSKDGQWLSGKDLENGVLVSQQTFDPATKTQTFTTFDGAGGIKLTWTMKDNKLVAFRENHPSSNQLGDTWSDPDNPNDSQKFMCQSDGRCDRFDIHYEYLDWTKRNLKSAEWRDSSGKVLYAAHYENELDSVGNWTHRKIFVTGPKQAERTLIEEDTRSLTYWQ